MQDLVNALTKQHGHVTCIVRMVPTTRLVVRAALVWIACLSKVDHPGCSKYEAMRCFQQSLVQANESIGFLSCPPRYGGWLEHYAWHLIKDIPFELRSLHVLVGCGLQCCILVLAGDDSQSSKNMLLGQFDLVGIPPAPMDVPQIEVTFKVRAHEGGEILEGAKENAYAHIARCWVSRWDLAGDV